MDRPQHDSDLRARLLALARELIGDEGDQPLTILIITGKVVAVQPGPQPEPPPGLRAYDRAILGALATRPLSAPQLARRSGRRFNSYFRQHLANLVEAGYVHRTHRGYARPLMFTTDA
jgi:hypothetical protein